MKRAIHLIICHTKRLRDRVPSRQARARKADEDIKTLSRGLKATASDGEKWALINSLRSKDGGMATEPTGMLAAG